MIPRDGRRIAAAAMLLALIAAGAPATADPLRLIDTDGPEQGERTLGLHELWRVGDRDDGPLFGRIAGVAIRPDGSVLVLDDQLVRVVVLSPEGRPIGTLGREGDGPGEFRNVISLAALPDGGAAVGIAFPGDVVRIDAAGDPLSTCHLVGEPADGHFGLLMSLRSRGGYLAGTGARLVLDPTGESRSHAERFLVITGSDCAAPVRALQRTVPLDPTGRRFVEREDDYPDTRWTLGRDGTVYAAPERDAYEIVAIAADGRVLRRFGRRFAPPRRTEAQKQEVRPSIHLTESVEEIVAEDHPPCIRRLLYDGDEDAIWVLAADGVPDASGDILQVWDVFSREGAYLRRIRLERPEGIVRGEVHLAGQGRMIIVPDPGDGAPVAACFAWR